MNLRYSGLPSSSLPRLWKSLKALIAERDFYKSCTNAAEERVKDLEHELVGAYTAFDNLEQRFERMGQKEPPQKGEEEGRT